MELHEEYLTRRHVKAPCIKYVDRANLILKAKKKDLEWAWLHINIVSNNDQNHPQKYTFIVSANPTLYSTPDLNHFSQHSKVVKEQIWEWEQYESGLIEFAKEHADNYVAITSQDAIFVAWEMFITNYDTWIAHFLPYRMHDDIFLSLSYQAGPPKMRAIHEVEEFIRERFEKVYSCWKSIKVAVEHKNYADWLAKIVNDMA